MEGAHGSIGKFFGVHSNLAMQSIHLLGNEEQRERFLPAMADLEKVGLFGLTEPDHGSDAVALETQCAPRGEEYVLNGEKKWIGNALLFADVCARSGPAARTARSAGTSSRRAPWGSRPS